MARATEGGCPYEKRVPVGADGNPPDDLRHLYRFNGTIAIVPYETGTPRTARGRPYKKMPQFEKFFKLGLANRRDMVYNSGSGSLWGANPTAANR